MDPTSETARDDSAFVHASAGGDAIVNHSLESFTTPEAVSSPGNLGPEKQAPNTTTKSEFALHVLQRTMKGKEKEWSSVAEKKRPLRLLDLPVDILREIIGQLPHANDLTSLALCHSILHSLAIPSIYARFDIVWPDQGMQTESRAGVDALTYGLATLCKAQEVFGEAAFQRQSSQKSKDDNASVTSLVPNPYRLRRRRLGNYYAQYTKKFSLGNGPADCVREYLITKEGGKMLGTLVALAVARMPSLETFVWDMPTGVLRDVWLALSSLADREDSENEGCRLDKVWVRWHNNWQTDPVDGVPAGLPPPPPPPNLPPPPAVNPHSTHNAHGTTGGTSHGGSTLPLIDRVEYPTFSVLPPLKSVTVLEVDELPYLDELSILIARSQDRLKELRVGIARHAQNMDWAANWEGEGLYQVDHNTTWTVASKISEKRLQGILGILVGRIYNLRHNLDTVKQESAGNLIMRAAIARSTDLPSASSSAPNLLFTSTPSLLDTSHLTSTGTSSLPETQNEAIPGPVETVTRPPTAPSTAAAVLSGTKTIPLRPSRPLRHDNKKNGPYLNGVLKLEVLELERVPLSIPVLQKAFDWPSLTNLTLLNCQGHERLWKLLRSRFTPTPLFKSRSDSSPPRRSRKNMEYYLNLKKIHTNTVSYALTAFIKETLAPNTLEVLFLQDGWESPVGIKSIFKNAVRRHRHSLRKLLIDSDDENMGDFPDPNAPRWRDWRLNRQIVTWMTSGMMTNLRELAICLDYSDWHVFLQRLPKVPNLRSLYIPHIADHPHGANIEPHELAMQILDIVTLRPEIQLCYMGIGTKCFEILENRPDDAHGYGTPGTSGNGPVGYTSIHDSSDDDADEEDDDDPNDDEGLDDEDDDNDTVSTAAPSDDSFDNSDDDEWHAHDSKKTPKLRLQEILFYDKVSIFKARYGKL